jgi:taurine--2-oxoglutarate transaminase
VSDTTTTLNGDALVQLNKDNVLFSWSVQDAVNPLPLVKAKGIYIWDANGNRYTDFSSQLMCSNLGHGHPRIIEAIQKQVADYQFFHPGYAHEQKGTLAAKLKEICPGNMKKVFFTLGGAEANENAIKIARMATGRFKVFSRYRSYHGATHGAAALSGDPRRFKAEPSIPGVIHFYGPYSYRCPFGSTTEEQSRDRALAHLEQTIQFEGSDSIAAIFLEGINGSSGLILYPDGYMEGVRALCDKYGILLVIDEVMSGFGRTGQWFGCNNYNARPDIITMAKGLTSAYLPLGAVAVSESISDHFDENPLVCGLTYSGHPVSCAAGIAVIDTFKDEGILSHTQKMGLVQQSHLDAMQAKHPSVGEIRNIGLFGVIEMVKNRETREPMTEWNATGENLSRTLQVASALREHGVMTFVRWNWLFCVPPLVINEEQLAEAYQAVDKALDIADSFTTQR